MRSISFDENHHLGKLLWKEGHPQLPTNYAPSLHRLRTQAVRLKKEPEVLREYAPIIDEQLQKQRKCIVYHIMP